MRSARPPVDPGLDEASACRLHRHQATRQLLSKDHYALRSHAATLDHRAVAIQFDDAAAVLAQVDPQHRDLHLPCLPSSACRPSLSLLETVGPALPLLIQIPR